MCLYYTVFMILLDLLKMRSVDNHPENKLTFLASFKNVERCEHLSLWSRVKVRLCNLCWTVPTVSTVSTGDTGGIMLNAKTVE